jgi:choline dehydrogenase-like flavoprotein
MSFAAGCRSNGRFPTELRGTDVPTRGMLRGVDLLEQHQTAPRGAATSLAMGIELLRNMMAHPILRQYEAAEVLPGPSYGTREQLEDYLRRYSAFNHHISGTAKMGRAHRSPDGRRFGMPRHGRGRPSRL